MGPVYIGTSGWVYKGWEKTFYPEDFSAKDHLEFYATQFRTVEINTTFYRLPSLKMVKGWRDRAPRHFLFAVKGSRYITHMKKLVDLGGGVNRFIRRIQPLGQHLGPILWQLPPFMGRDLNRLDAFLKRTPRHLRQAVEFRHPSWYDDPETFALLRRHGVAHVSLSSMGMPMNLSVTADFLYIRFHGLKDGPAHDYTAEELEPWAKHIRAHSKAGRAVFVYFNNDLNVRAPANAKMLQEMVSRGATHARVATR